MKIMHSRNGARALLSVFCMILLSAGFAYCANEPASKAATAATGSGMTLWQTLVAGGSVMIVIGLLSLVAGTIIIYDIITFKTEKLLPRKLYENILSKLENYDIKSVRELCVKENNIMSRIVLAGLNKAKKNLNDVSVKEAMEQKARIEIGSLWQNLNYLSDIVTVAPLLGLLGTVFGMIQAFSAVPLQSTGVKVPVMVAGISKAMVATGAGLVVAIAVLIAYSFFRGRVQELSNVIETYTDDIIKAMENL